MASKADVMLIEVAGSTAGKRLGFSGSLGSLTIFGKRLSRTPVCSMFVKSSKSAIVLSLS